MLLFEEGLAEELELTFSEDATMADRCTADFGGFAAAVDGVRNGRNGKPMPTTTDKPTDEARRFMCPSQRQAVPGSR